MISSLSEKRSSTLQNTSFVVVGVILRVWTIDDYMVIIVGARKLGHQHAESRDAW